MIIQRKNPDKHVHLTALILRCAGGAVDSQREEVGRVQHGLLQQPAEVLRAY